MKTKNYQIGLLLTCLLLLSACAKDHTSSVPVIIKTGCPAVSACTLSATNPQSNDNLLTDTETLEADWARCAVKVDTVIKYNEQINNEQARQP